MERGESYYVDLSPTVGREQSGRRPVVVLSIDEINSRPLVVTVVVGTKGTNVQRDYRINVRLGPDDSGLPHATVFLCFQVRSLDARRFPAKPSGKLSEWALEEIEDTVRYCLGL